MTKGSNERKKTFNNLAKFIIDRINEIDNLKPFIYDMKNSENPVDKIRYNMINREKNKLIYIMKQFNFDYIED